MRFTSPLAFIGLILLIPIIMLGWPSRGYSRRREIVSLGLRIIICTALILGLAGLEIKDAGRSNSLAVTFLLDVSDSMPPAAIQAGLDFIQQALQEKRSNDQAALIVFGREAFVEKAMSTELDLTSITSIPLTNQTDLAQAVNLALALYPGGTARRMVVLSDGAFTTGNTLEALQVAAASNVEVVGVPFVVNPAPEVLIQEISAPQRLREGDRFDLNVTLDTNQAQKVTISVFSNGSLIYEGEHEIFPEQQTFNLPLTADQPGFTSYQVSVSSQSDRYYQNNQLSTYTQIAGAPKVLVVAAPAGEEIYTPGDNSFDEAGPLLEVLQASGYQVDRVIPELLPGDLPGLAGFSTVVLVDVPARRLTADQMLSLQSYMRDLGGGLVVIGGPNSFGVGGYFKTPLEEILPVDMQIKDEKRRPSLAIVFILDRSGSMSETSGGPTKLDLAKEAVIRSLDLLSPTDQVGVIAFDDAASWVVPVIELGDGSEVRSKVASIGIGGGTDILAGVQAMAAVIPGIEAGARHVILLTDGGADPTGIPELVEYLYSSEGITISTIGVGRDAAPFLADLAVLGGGRYHFAENPASIPNIYTEETSLATRAYLIEEAFIPEEIVSSPIIEGVDGFPELLGYVGTSPKQTAQTILVSHHGDPILAEWRYGLGKSIAFTSDASGRWAQQWLSWSDFPVFWAQIIQDSISNAYYPNLEIQTSFQDGKARIFVDGSPLNEANSVAISRYLNNYNLQANIIQPDGDHKIVDFHQVAPGRYETEFEPTTEGVYLLHVTGDPPESGMETVSETAGWTLDYSPEYRALGGNPDHLANLVYQVGGYLASQDPGLLFEHNLPAPGIYNPAWPWLLVIAGLLLPFDIAVRRLVITKSDLQKFFQVIRSMLILRGRKPGKIQESPGRLRELLNVKERTTQRLRPSAEDGLQGRRKTWVSAPLQAPFSDDAPEQEHKGETMLLHSQAASDTGKESGPDQESEEPVSSVKKLLAKKRSQRKS